MLSNESVNYVEFVAKKRAKAKKLKVKRKYLILQKKNKRLQKF